MSAADPKPPPVQQLGPAVLVQGPALRVLLGLVASGIRQLTRNGTDVPHDAKALLAATTAAVGHAGTDTPDVRTRPTQAASDQITAAEAANILGRDPRTVRRLAGSLGGSKNRNGWTFSRAAVAGYARERDNT